MSHRLDHYLELDRNVTYGESIWDRNPDWRVSEVRRTICYGPMTTTAENGCYELNYPQLMLGLRLEAEVRMGRLYSGFRR